jgi:hypothetical protein
MSVKTKRPVTNLRVHYTKDYSKFQKIDTNRVLDKSNFKKIERSMIENGLMVDPIKINEDWEIVDGQHRLAVSEKLGLGIYYIQVKGIGKKEMIVSNAVKKSWNMTNFLDHYVKEGRASYVKLKKFRDEFPMFSITDCVVFLSNGIQHWNGDMFRNGEFEAGSLNKAMELAEQVMKLKQVFPQGYKRGVFVRTLLSTNRQPDFVMEEFIKKSMIVPSEYFQIKGDRKGTKRMIEDIYNYKRRRSDKITIKV